MDRSLAKRIVDGGVTVATKPVIGRKRTFTYETKIERDGKMVTAQVVEERSAQVGTLGLIVAAIATAVLGGAALGAFDNIGGRGEGELTPWQEAKAKRIAGKIRREQSFLGLGLLQNPFHSASDEERKDFGELVVVQSGKSREEVIAEVRAEAAAQGKTPEQTNFILYLMGLD